MSFYIPGCLSIPLPIILPAKLPIVPIVAVGKYGQKSTLRLSKLADAENYGKGCDTRLDGTVSPGAPSTLPPKPLWVLPCVPR
jgi:hypothetical protein